MTAFATTPCKGCGTPIVWARDANGKAIPLDPKPATYGVKVDPQLGAICVRANGADSVAQVYVSHFATCPKANEFSRARKSDRALELEAEREMGDDRSWENRTR